LGKIIGVLIEKKAKVNFDSLLGLALDIEEPYRRMEILIDILKNAPRGKFEKILQKTREIIKEMPYETNRINFLMSLANIQQNRFRAELIEEAVKIARQISDPATSLNTLTALLPQVPEENERQEMCDAILASIDTVNLTGRVEILIRLAQRCPIELRQHCLDLALRQSLQISSTYDQHDRAKLLINLARLSNTTDRQKILDHILDTLKSGGSENGWSVDIAQKMISGKDFESLAAYALNDYLSFPLQPGQTRPVSPSPSPALELSPEQAQKALDLLLGIPNIEQRVTVLTDIAEFLKKDQQTIVLKEVLDTVSQINDNTACFQIITHLIEYLPETEQSAAFEQNLTFLEKIGWEDQKKLLEEAKPNAENWGTDAQNRYKDKFDNLTKPSQFSSWRSRRHVRSRQTYRPAGDFTDKDMLKLIDQLDEKKLQSVADEIFVTLGFIQNVAERVRLTVLLARRLPENQRAMILNRLLLIIHQSSDKEAWISPLEENLDFFSADALNELIQLAKALENAEKRTDFFYQVVKKFPSQCAQEHWADLLLAVTEASHEWDKVSILRHLFAYISEEKWGDVFLVEKDLQEDSARSDLMLYSLEHLSEKWLEYVLNNAKKISDPGSRAHILTDLSKRLKGGIRENAVQQAYQITQKIDKGYFRAWALISLIDLMPDRKSRLIDEIIHITSSLIYEFGDRASILLGILKHISEDEKEKILIRLFIDASKERNVQWQEYNYYSFDRSRLLQRLADHQDQITYFNKWMMISNVLPNLATFHRKEFLSDIGSLMPVLVALGGEAVAREMYVAISDVVTWWP
jgi:hypothetical protein